MKDNSDEISADAARQVLAQQLTHGDQRRVQELLEKNSIMGLTPEERQELENLNHIADLLSLGHSRARQALKRSE